MPSRLIEVLRADQDTESMKVVQLWDSMTTVNCSILGLEAIALGSGISPRRLWELYCGATMIQARESVAVQIAEGLPAIMRVTIKDAKKAKGFASRDHVYKAARVLPTPKGSTTNINMPGSQQQQLEDGNRGGGDDDAGMLEPSDDFLMKTARAMNGKQLPATTAPTVEAENRRRRRG
jgi:hypothetical protein